MALVAVSLLTVKAEHDRVEAIRAAWQPVDATWVATRDLPPGHRLEADDVEPRSLPTTALPLDATGSSPVGLRIRDAIGEGEILRDGRLHTGPGGAAGSVVGETRGAIALTSPTPHLEPGDRVDLYALLTGTRVAVDAEVIDLTDGIALVAVVEADLSAVIQSFTTGDVVPVLVG